MGLSDVAAVTEWHRERPTVYRRSRRRMVRLLWQGAAAAVGLFRGHRRVIAEWREEAGRMSTEAFWRSYLGIDRGATPAPVPVPLPDLAPADGGNRAAA